MYMCVCIYTFFIFNMSRTTGAIPMTRLSTAAAVHVVQPR